MSSIVHPIFSRSILVDNLKIPTFFFWGAFEGHVTLKNISSKRITGIFFTWEPNYPGNYPWLSQVTGSGNNPAHKLFVFRSTLAMVLSFLFGWVGLERAMVAYSFGAVVTVSVVVANTGQAGFSLGLIMTRLNSAVIGTVIGQAVQQVLVACHRDRTLKFRAPMFLLLCHRVFWCHIFDMSRSLARSFLTLFFFLGPCHGHEL